MVFVMMADCFQHKQCLVVYRRYSCVNDSLSLYSVACNKTSSVEIGLLLYAWYSITLLVHRL